MRKIPVSAMTIFLPIEEVKTRFHVIQMQLLLGEPDKGKSQNGKIFFGNKLLKSIIKSFSKTFHPFLLHFISLSTQSFITILCDESLPMKSIAIFLFIFLFLCTDNRAQSFYQASGDAQHWVDSVFNKLSKKERIAQLMVVRLSAKIPAGVEFTAIRWKLISGNTTSVLFAYFKAARCSKRRSSIIFKALRKRPSCFALMMKRVWVCAWIALQNFQSR